MAMQITGSQDPNAYYQANTTTAARGLSAGKSAERSGGSSASSTASGTATAKTGQTASGTSSADAKTQAQIQELVQIQNKVIAHEQAHMAAGGGLAGTASYSYTVGPDGKRYISGGEVPINTPSTDDPNEKVQLMGRVIAAAMAPADPSSQDRRVAASASAAQSQAYMELARSKAQAAYGKNSTDKAGKSGEGQSPSRTESDVKVAGAEKGNTVDITV